MTEDRGKPTGKVGTIVKENPILRYSAKGTAFTKFTLQVKPYIVRQLDEAIYYDVTCFGSLAEHVAESMKKGYRVGVIGLGKVEEWTSKTTGKSGTSNVIVADFVGPDLRFVNATLSASEEPAAAPVYEEEPF